MIIDASPILIHIMMTWFIILITAGIILAILQSVMQKRMGIVLIDMVIVAICQIVYLPLRAVSQYRDMGRTFDNWLDYSGQIPFVAFAFCAVLMTAFECLSIMSSMRFRKKHITTISIYESFQKLPVGICCYRDGGMTKLVNAKMNQIAKELTNCSITNGESFLATLREEAAGNRRVLLDHEPDDFVESSNEEKSKDSAGETIVLQLDGGAIISFAVTEIPYKNIMLHEIIATDVTQEYRNLELLHQEKKRMQQLNNRLRAYSKKIVNVNIEKEILEAKVQIHDELGHALIVSKQFLKNGDGDKEAILRLWRKNIALLKDERQEQLPEDYDTMFYIAKCAGVEITVDGDLPKEPERIKRIVVMAMSECLTNVCRHAHGDQLMISVKEGVQECIKDSEPKKWSISFTNNGDAPSEEIKEGGGLTNLRKIVESESGEMVVKSLPSFKLEIILPDGEK